MVEGADVHTALARAGYRVEAMIGRGGTGTVYRAVQIRLRRDVALKLLSPDRTDDPLFRAGFLEESIRTASLEHPHIVPIYDAGEIDGLLYIAMRYVAGRDLQALIRREGRLSPHAAVSLLEQIAGALQAAHDAGLVHRDVKPSNVLIGGDPGTERPLHAWLGDFGLAHRMGDTAQAATEQPLGTVAYVAPEQIRGERVDPRADVYSLGCLLHECLTGRVPFDLDTVPAVLYAHLESPPPQVSSLGLGLGRAMDAVLARALAKRPEERPSSALELADAAARAVSGAGARFGTGDRTPSPVVPARASAADPPPSPPPSTRRTPAPPRLIGRLSECEELATRLDDALAGAGALALLTGEAGIGKTALARELSRLAEARGTPVAWGVALGAGASRAYGHWVQIVRQIADGREGDELLAGLGPDAAALRTLVPELPAALAPGRPAVEGGFAIRTALLRLLGAAGRRNGLLVVLDDLHLADEASLQALSYIARALTDHRILLLGTQRDLENGPRELAELAGIAHCLTLQGLSEGDVRAMVQARRHVSPADRAVARIRDQTGGNPLFISQVLGLIERDAQLTDPPEDPEGLPLPPGVRAAIAARLGGLGPAALPVLQAAAVAGRRFRAGILADALGTEPAELLEHLDAAYRQRLLRPLPGSADGYAFEHGLVQATLLAGLGRRRRMDLHHAIAGAMERAPAAVRPAPADIADHHLAAAPAYGPDEAIAAARRAADAATAAYAYDIAVDLYRRALEVGPVGDRDRLELMQALGEAELRAGETESAQRTLRAAAELAGRCHDDPAFARATLAQAIWGLSFGVDESLVGLAEEAIDRLAGDPADGLLARLKVFLAVLIYWTGEVERRERLADEALALARRAHAERPSLETAATLAYVAARALLARWGPDSADRDLAASDEALELACAINDGELELLVRNWRITTLLELGRFGAVDAEIARVEQMAVELRQPRAMVFLPLHHATRAATAGRFDEAERLNAEAAEIARRVRGSVGELAGSAQLITIRLQQGRLPELEPPMRAMVNAHPEMVGLRCALGILLMQAERPAEARAVLDDLIEAGPAGLPRDCTHVLMLALVGELAAALGDRARCAQLLDWLSPYAGRWAVSTGASALWPVDRVLGRLAAALGRHDEALAHLARAREQAERGGARPALALIALDEARVRQARDDPGDPDRALVAVRAALDLAGEAGAGMIVDAAVAVEVELEAAGMAG